MALNPYTLYHLYEKGILEYVPVDLMGGTPVAPMMPVTNPYLDMAQNGDLYQNYGMNNDTFTYNQGIQSPYTNQPSNPIPAHTTIGVASQAGGLNTFNGVGIGGYSQAGGMNTFNGVGIGGQNQNGSMDILGGVGTVGNGLANGYNRTISAIDRVPRFILGLAAAAIGIIGLKHAFKGGKIFGKKNVNNSDTGSHLSKLNPKNWGWFGKKS